MSNPLVLNDQPICYSLWLLQELKLISCLASQLVRVFHTSVAVVFFFFRKADEYDETEDLSEEEANEKKNRNVARLQVSIF